MEDRGAAASASFDTLPPYLGGVSSSLGHLPPWYQILSLGGVLWVIHLRNNVVVTWLVVQLHSSLGAESIWMEEYQATLQDMAFTERLCFTLYGASLAAVVMVLYRIFCKDRWCIGWSIGNMFPDKKLLTTAMVLLLCVAESIRLRQVIREQLETPGSLSRLAMHHFKGIETSDFDPALGESNPHFVIHFELVREYVWWAFLRRLPAFLLAGGYRFFRDVPRKVHVALRWYTATIATFLLLQEVLQMYIRNSWTDWGAWAVVAWALVFVGVVNFVYGPTKRAGAVVTISVANCVKEAVRGLVASFALWFIACLIGLTVVVSVHEELVLIWLFFSLMILWTPAIVDSIATDYMAFLSIAVAFVFHAMGGASSVASSLRFGALHFLLWFFPSLLYNASLHVSASRYGAMVVTMSWFCWALTPPNELWSNRDAMAALGLDNGYGLVPLFTARVVWLRAVANFDTLPQHSWMYTLAQGDGSRAFDLILRATAVLSVVCIAISSVVEHSLNPEALLQWQQRDIVSATPAVLMCKILRTVVVVGCTAAAAGVWWFLRLYVLSVGTQLIPDIVAKALCTVGAVTILGNLMDMQDTIYIACIRVLGIRNPGQPPDTPLSSDEDTSNTLPLRATSEHPSGRGGMFDERNVATVFRARS